MTYLNNLACLLDALIKDDAEEIKLAAILFQKLAETKPITKKEQEIFKKLLEAIK